MQKLIRTTLFSVAFLLFGASVASAQTTIFSETFDSDLGQFSQFSVASDENWSQSTDGGDGFAAINGFGADEASDDWLISSALDMSSTTSEELTADIGNEFGGPDLMVKVSTDYSGSGDPTGATWTEEATVGSAGSVTVDMSGYSGNSSVYVAFHYVSDGTGGGEAADYQVDDVEVTSIENPIVRFASATSSAAEDAGSTNLTVELAGPDPSNAIDVDVAFNSGNSEADAGDIDNYSTQTVSFDASASSGDTKTVSVSLTDDMSNEGNEVAQFELTNLSTSGGASIGSPSSTDLSIIDDDQTFADAREALRNGNAEEVILEGTVSRAYGSYARFQDESGATGATGLVVRQTSGPLSADFQADIENGNIQPGTMLRVRGTLSQFSGLVQLNGSDVVGYQVMGQGNPPTPQTVSLSDLAAPGGEDYESELLRITGLTFPNASGTFEADTGYEVSDGSNTMTFYVQSTAQSALSGESVPTGSFTYEGVLGQFNSFGGVDTDEGYQLIPVRPETALPVEMAGFDAVQNGSSVELRWQTASETNNAGFNIQHETDRGWTTLGFVESKATGGTTTEAQSYRYTVDRELDPGTHRFRLKQTDLDGSTSLSSVETIEVSMDAALRITAPAPNPAVGTTTLSIGAREASDATVALYNVLGQRVKTLSQRPLKAGQMRDVTFDASALPSGVYFVRLQANGHTRTERLTVVR
jgi:hypothetical protein